MNQKIYNKLFDGQYYVEDDEHGKPIPIIRIIKEGNRYTVFNIKKPFLREYYNTQKNF